MDRHEIEAELAAMGKFTMGQVIGEKWKIVQKLDEGGFGSVYKVQNLKDTKRFAALKVERASEDEINYLKLETCVLKELHANGIRAHVPELFRSAKRKHYCYIIITLLGDNLKKLKDKYFPDGMSKRTWSRVGIQCLYGIKTMHDRGFIHRDIKAQNFVLGWNQNPSVARIVYIIDFGLARGYAYPPSKTNGKWMPRRARARLEFRGTWRYAAPSMHEEQEQGRKDDLWSWLYMMMDLYCGLPWLENDSKEVIELKKLRMSDKDLMTRMPDELKFIPEHLRKLDMYARPDYQLIHHGLDQLRKKSKASFEDSYEWETKEQIVENLRAMKNKSAAIGYTDADPFFKSDPIQISHGPALRDPKDIRHRMKSTPPTGPVNTPKEIAAMMISGSQSASRERGHPTKPVPVIPAKVTVPKTPKPEKPAISKSTGGKTVQKTPPPHPPPVINPPSPSKIDVKAKVEVKIEAAPKMEETKAKKTSISAQEKYKEKKKKTIEQPLSMEEESTDFVPSCYMQLDIPKVYMPTNLDNRHYQEKAVSMDWGHAPASHMSQPTETNNNNIKKASPGKPPSPGNTDVPSSPSKPPVISDRSVSLHGPSYYLREQRK